MAEVAESTVAMSLYNVVAAEGAQTLAQARELLARHGYLLATSALELALRQLVERGLAVVEGERLSVTGPAGHVVVSRNRDDPEGWAGWRVAPFERRKSEPLVGRFLA